MNASNCVRNASPWVPVFAVGLLALAGAEPAHAQSRSLPVQLREHGYRVSVSPEKVIVDDGDTVVIEWEVADRETIRILGIDTPETRHVPHNIPVAQEYGPEARAFGQGAFAAATEVELLRSATLDPFRRTLGYLFINGKNYSVLVVEARLAEESVTRYGDNGLPEEAAAVLDAAEKAGPLPFESPGDFRRRMRDYSQWLRENDIDPDR